MLVQITINSRSKTTLKSSCLWDAKVYHEQGPEKTKHQFQKLLSQDYSLKDFSQEPEIKFIIFEGRIFRITTKSITFAQ